MAAQMHGTTAPLGPINSVVYPSRPRLQPNFSQLHSNSTHRGGRGGGGSRFRLHIVQMHDETEGEVTGGERRERRETGRRRRRRQRRAHGLTARRRLAARRRRRRRRLRATSAAGPLSQCQGQRTGWRRGQRRLADFDGP